MSDNLMDKVNALGERLKISGAEVSRKMSTGVTSMSFKMKEFFQGQNMADKIVDEATLETMDGPDWATNLEICDMANTERVNSVELIRAIKRRIMLKSPRVQYLALVLLETIVKNCDKAFSEIAAERVLDEMVKLIDDPQTIVNNRNKALMLIEAWGESGEELRYLPVFEETYKSLRSRGIRFPGRDDESLAPIFTPPRSVPAAEPYSDAAQDGYQEIPDESLAPVRAAPSVQVDEAFEVARNSVELLSTVLSSSPQKEALEDDLTTTLVQQCQQCQHTIQRIVETAGDNEAQLFEALSIHDELQKVLSKYEDLKEPIVAEPEPEPAMIPVTVEPEESPRAVGKDTPARKSAGSGGRSSGGDDLLQDLDDMIFGKKAGTSSQQERTPRKEQKDDFTGSRWVVVPGSEVLGADAPKVVGWEELQQELARLWSLSAALAAARDRKAGLAARLESALEARKAFLQQDNELAEMRQRLQSHADFMGELRMQTKEVSANVEDRREQLCVKIRTLTVADKTVGAAQSKLQVFSCMHAIENWLHCSLLAPVKKP